MMNRKNNQPGTAVRRKNPLPVILLNIALVISAVILVVAVINLVREVQDVQRGYYSESGARYRVEGEEFGRLAADYIDNERIAEDDLDEPEYVAQYMIAAYFYRANAEAGDTALAEKNRAEMDSARSHLTTYQAAADRIDVILGVK